MNPTNSSIELETAVETAGTEDSSEAIVTRSLSVRYGDNLALDSISMSIASRKVTSLIGPSGCGKTTFLKCLNRMNDLIEDVRVEGSVVIGGRDVYADNIDVIALRKQVGMVFQMSNPFPKSIFENVAFGMRVQGTIDGSELSGRVEQSLKQAALWDEVKDQLEKNALELSGGQQQRLCIARAIAIEPSILLMDEPASALDPIATSRIEDLIIELKDRYTIVIVTHNMQQAARISDRTAFLYLGRLVEYDETSTIFTNPSKRETEDYVTGRFG